MHNRILVVMYLPDDTLPFFVEASELVRCFILSCPGPPKHHRPNWNYFVCSVLFVDVLVRQSTTLNIDVNMIPSLKFHESVCDQKMCHWNCSGLQLFSAVSYLSMTVDETHHLSECVVANA